MMIVDVAIALGGNDIDKGMARQLIEHMIEETNAGCNIGKADPSRSGPTRLVSFVLRTIRPCAWRFRNLCCTRGVIARRAALPELRRQARPVARLPRRYKIG
jgi:hypothetical protein